MGSNFAFRKVTAGIIISHLILFGYFKASCIQSRLGSGTIAQCNHELHLAHPLSSVKRLEKRCFSDKAIDSYKDKGLETLEENINLSKSPESMDGSSYYGIGEHRPEVNIQEKGKAQKLKRYFGESPFAEASEKLADNDYHTPLTSPTVPGDEKYIYQESNLLKYYDMRNSRSPSEKEKIDGFFFINKQPNSIFKSKDQIHDKPLDKDGETEFHQKRE
ncbi:hypothetical protein BY996DRAFT_6415455 [Phakopsora pachyrhizi]|nr:hypothetical protein BY996DRAFT_6415455 [Phakopsora pachyrhizi]